MRIRFFWVAMQERGSMKAIKYGLKYLEDATNALPKADLDVKRRRKLEHEIDAMRDDLENQKKLHYNTHYGVFSVGAIRGTNTIQ